MRFLADMGVSPLTVAFLRESGHDVVRLSDEGLEASARPSRIGQSA